MDADATFDQEHSLDARLRQLDEVRFAVDVIHIDNAKAEVPAVRGWRAERMFSVGRVFFFCLLLANVRQCSVDVQQRESCFGHVK